MPFSDVVTPVRYPALHTPEAGERAANGVWLPCFVVRLASPLPNNSTHGRCTLGAERLKRRKAQPDLLTAPCARL
jgi:hypothetical protein